MGNIKNKKTFEVISKVMTIILIFTLVLPREIGAITVEQGVETIIINDHDTGIGSNKFTYSAGWSTSTNLPNMFHNGDEHWVVINKGDTSAKSKYYTISFEGNKIELYGDKGPMLGKYSVSVDGGEEIVINAYNDSKIHKQKLFESNALEEGAHTITVRGTGEGTGNSADMQVDYAKVMRSLATATSVELSMNEVEIEIGAIQNLKATIYPENSINKEIIWSVEDLAVATVENGLVKGRGVGTTKVIATVKDTNIKAECIVKVKQESTEAIYTTNINDSKIGTGVNNFQYFGKWGSSSGTGYYGGDEHWSSIPIGSPTAKDNYSEIKFYGNKIEIYGTTGPKHGIYSISIDDGEEVEVDAYSSSRIDQQKIYESPKLAHGVHIIRIKGTGKATGSEASIQLDYAKSYHYEIQAESIEMTNKSITLEQGIQSQLSVIFNPDNTSVKDLEWSSSDENIVTVDKGKITAIKSGEAIVTAKLVNSKLEAKCNINVIEGNEYIGGFIGTTERHHLQEKYSDYVTEFNSFEELTAWKGDKAISKIVLYSKINGAKNITAISSTLVNEYGDSIDSSNVKATFLKDVSATLGGAQPGQGLGQVIPNQPRQDVPEILYTTNPVSVEANKLQQIWVEFNIPRDAKPGIYTGEIEVTADGVKTPLIFDYQVEVLDILQPSYEESKFHLDLWQYPYSVARYYDVEPFSQEHLDILKPHMELYKNAGGKTITTTIVEDAWNNQTYDKYTSMVKWTKKSNGTFEFDYTDFDKWVSFNLALGINKQISAFSIVPWQNRIIYFDEAKNKEVEEFHSPGTAQWTNMWSQFLDSFVPHLDKKGWFDMVYIAMDERPVNQMLPALDLIESKANKDGHTLKVSGAMNYSTMDRNVLNRIHDISIHAAHTNHTNGEVRALSEERRALGLNTTLYTCTGSYPSNFTRSEPSDNIWTIWYSAYHNTDGYLRWALDAWTENPLEDSSHWYFEAGDTFLMYPGDKGTDNITPRSSVRLEKIAEAIRDVEKVMYIKENSPELSVEVDKLLDSINRYAGYGNGFGMNEGSEATKKAIANEAVRIKETVSRISKEYAKINKIAVESIALDKLETVLKVGESTTLVATVLPENATNKNIIWQSSDESIATVKNGIVTAVEKGVVEIIATTIDGNLEARCTVTVQEDIVEEVNKDALKIAIDYAEEIKLDGALEGVVPAVVRAFEKALDNANRVYSNTSATNEEVDLAFKELLDAIHMLEFKQGDKTHLEKLVVIINNLNSNKYIAETWDNLQVKLDNAKLVIEDVNAMEEEVQSTYSELMRAYLHLRLKPDKSLLEDLINKAKKIDLSKYTEKSVNKFKVKYSEAVLVLENKDATQEEINNVTDDLRVAIKGLESKTENNGNTKPNKDNNSEGDGNKSEENGNKSGDISNELPKTGGRGIEVLLFGIGIFVSGIALIKRKKANLN